MLNVKATYVDKQAGANGVWIDYLDGSRFLIASTANPKYKAALMAGGKKNGRIMKTNSPESVVAVTEVICEAMAKHILLGWDGVSLDGETPLPYSRDTAYEILLNSEEIRNFVSEQADLASNFQLAVMDEVKNSSSGTSTGVTM